MELRALRYLTAVVEAGSFASAAAQLGMNSSNLTRQISSLEDELGLTLLERSRVGIRLTSGGAAVMIEVRRMLADLDAIAGAARSNGVGKHGELRLGGVFHRLEKCSLRCFALGMMSAPMSG
jgi:LysR family transcriptional regulator, benzoate and cis,cis-muconate-responsive activator of ben and cat genes